MRFWLLALPSYLFHGFHLLNNPLPLRQRKGFFLPRNIPTKNFSENFFKTTPRRLFADFLARICDEGNGCLLLAIGGGYPLFVGLWACRWLCSASFLFPLLLRLFRLLRSLFPCGLPFPIGWQHREHLNPSGRLVLLCSSFCWVVLGFPASVRLSVLDSLGA